MQETSQKTYIGRIAPKAGWGGYPIPIEPGTIPPTNWVDGMSTLATFDGASSSANIFKLNLYD